LEKKNSLLQGRVTFAALTNFFDHFTSFSYPLNTLNVGTENFHLVYRPLTGRINNICTEYKEFFNYHRMRNYSNLLIFIRTIQKAYQ